MNAINIPDTVHALVVRQAADEKSTVAAFEDLPYADLPKDDVLVKIAYSTLNYKDGLALTGGRIVRKFPMVAGIDLAGTVIQSDSPKWKCGDTVILNGFGLSETHWGGYSTYQRVKSEWLVALPPPLSLADAMAIGTAGYTSMLAVMALEKAGLKPGDKPVLVTGAAGGVGSIAVALLSSLGYQVTASTGRRDTHEYLKYLGASHIVDRTEFMGPHPALGSELWQAAIDCVGGETLATVLSQISYEGSVAACGLAGGSNLPATVMPFILRGVNLLGINSVMTPLDKRVEAWSRLSRELPAEKLKRIANVYPFEQLVDLAPKILDGRIQGRVVIKIDE